MAKARTCDRCNKTIRAKCKDGDYYVVEVNKYNVNSSGRYCWYPPIELCEECINKFNDFIKTY